MTEFRHVSTRDSSSGSVPLGFGFEQYAGLVVTGFFGTIPTTTWLVSIAAGLHLLDSHPTRLAADPVVSGIGVAFVMAGMLVAPWLVPCLVLRARQPRGARIEWNADEIVEWDGPFRRAAIAWKDLQLGELLWSSSGRGGLSSMALQLTSRTSDQVITVWTSRPDKAPKIRRRLWAGQLTELRKAIAEREVAPSGHVNWSRAADPDRPVHRRATILGRFGYPLAVFAPMAAPAFRDDGRSWTAILVAVVAFVLLAIRAAPAFREVLAILRRRKTAGSAGVAPVVQVEDEANPYRAVALEAPVVTIDIAGRVAADRLKLRAALVESLVRAACAVMVPVSTAINLFAMK